MIANGERKMKNTKLEMFLKRTLKPDVYGDIRWYEPVVLKRDKPFAYKQVVVTGEEILLVDTPPKDVTTLLSISTITAVLLVHDLPEFLEGGLRDRTTHILLKVRSEDGPKIVYPKIKPSFNFEKLSTSRRGSVQGAISEESPSEILSKRVLHVDQNGAKGKVPKWKKFLERRCSRDVLSVTNSDLDKLNISKRDFLLPSALKFRGVSVPEVTEERRRRQSCSVNSLYESENQDCIEEMAMECPPFSEGVSTFLGVRQEFGQRPLSPALCDVLNRVDPATFIPNGMSSTPDLTARQAMPRSLSAFETYHRTPISTALRSRSVLDKPLHSHNNIYLRRSQSMTHVNMNEFSEGEEEIHLYTLSTSTHLFHLLHSLWMASLMVTATDCIPGFISPHSPLQLNEESMDLTFRSLCTDLREATTVEQHLSLLQDLRIGIKNYTTVRRIFWRDTEALSLVRRLLRRYSSSKSSPSTHCDDDDYCKERELELKVVILALEVIESSLAHSQGCPLKIKTIKSKSLLEELLEEVFSIPDILPPHNLMCQRFLTNIKELSECSWHYLPEKQLLQTLQKVIQSSIVAASYLFEAISELGWSEISKENRRSRKKEEETSYLNILLRYVPIEDWLSYAIPQFFLLVQPKTKEVEGVLDRDDVVLTYQCLSVLLVLLKQSPKALSFCVTNHSMEFRYFVRESVLRKKFDSLDPLSPHAFRLLKSISKLVLR